MKRVLLEQDENNFKNVLTDLQQYRPVLNLVKQTYENLDIGSFDNAVLKQITQNGIIGIEKTYFEKCESDFKNMNTSNQTIRKNVLNGIDEVFNEFRGATNQFKKFRPETYSRTQYLKPSQISVENGIFYISAEDQESIYENGCRTYLENEKDFELYENLKKFIEAFNTVNENLKELEYRFSYEKGKGVTAIENTFLMTNENDIYSINPGSIKFAANYKENSLKFNL